jgi:hypothetical protein
LSAWRHICPRVMTDYETNTLHYDPVMRSLSIPP